MTLVERATWMLAERHTSVIIEQDCSLCQSPPHHILHAFMHLGKLMKVIHRLRHLT